MSAVEHAVDAAFGENSSRIPTANAEVLYEYDSKYGAVNISASSQEKIGVCSTPTNKSDLLWLLLNSTL